MTAAIGAHGGPRIRSGAVRRAGHRRFLPFVSRSSDLASRRREAAPTITPPKRSRRRADASTRSARRSRSITPQCCMPFAARAARPSNAAGSRGTVQPVWLRLLPCDGECPHRLGDAAEGEVAAGLAQLREGLDGLRALSAELRLPYYYALLAETLGRAGLVGEALASVSTGFAFASKNGERWAVAELHRVAGRSAGCAKESANRRAPASGAVSRQRGGAVSLAFERRLLTLAGRNGRSPPPQNALRTPRRAK